MERCKTCKHWDPVTAEEIEGRWALIGSGGCKAARQLWDVTERPPPDYDVLTLLPEHAGLLCAVVDGSEYRAEFITMPDFGCVMHEMA